MDIVRITLSGYGYDVVRGIVEKRNYNELKDSKSLNDIWVKNLNDKITKSWHNFTEDFRDYGITNGDISITVNDEEIIDLPIHALRHTFEELDWVDLEGYQYPVTEDVVVTSIQKLEGTFMDVIFVTEDDFDLSKLKFIEKEIHNEKEETVIDSLISEIYYDGELIDFTGDNTELRMSNIFFEKVD